ncbi:MAG: hypothetical protein QM710_14760 [Flavobacterium sp.]
MKVKNFFWVVILLYLQNANAQNFAPGDVIKFTANVPFSGNAKLNPTVNLANATNYADVGTKFRIVSINAANVEVIALNYNVPSANTFANRAADVAKGKTHVPFKSEVYNGIIYTLKRSDFDAFAIRVENHDRWAVGLLSLPFKARPQDGMSFDTEFNLNLTLNTYLFQVRGSSLNLQAGAGIGSVGLNTSNASGMTNDEAEDVALLTGLAGVMIQYKRVQIGLYAGVDFINNQKHYNWESNGNLWLGFGVGYDLFQVSAAPPSNKGN